MLGDVGHLDRVAQIGLVGAVLGDRRVVGNARPPLGHRLAVSELLEHAGHHRLHGLEDIFLLDETHFDVELIEFARQTVGARIFVAETRGNLKIAVESRHHQELLVLLRCLRQCVELTRMNAARHQEVARAFRRGRGEDRRCKLVEPGLFHALANGFHDGQAGHDVAMQRFATQIEEAIGQPQIFRIVWLAEHRNGKFLRLAQDFEAGRQNFDLAGRKLLVRRAFRTLAHDAVNAHHPLRTHSLDRLERGTFAIGDNLRHAVVVAQVDEKQAAVIAHPMNPARQAHGRADIRSAQRPAGVRAIAVGRGRGCHWIVVLNRMWFVGAGKAHAPLALSSLPGRGSMS